MTMSLKIPIMWQASYKRERQLSFQAHAFLLDQISSHPLNLSLPSFVIILHRTLEFFVQSNGSILFIDNAICHCTRGESAHLEIESMIVVSKESCSGGGIREDHED